MIKRILAIDPGITTGYCIMSTDGTIIESGNLDIDDLLEEETVLDDYAVYSTLTMPTTLVVIEEIPTFANSELGRSLRAVIEHLTRMYPMANWIRPTEWKSIGPISNYPVPKTWTLRMKTPHQKDAFRIGTYYLTRKGVQQYGGNQVE